MSVCAANVTKSLSAAVAVPVCASAGIQQIAPQTKPVINILFVNIQLLLNSGLNYLIILLDVNGGEL
jgi:hypothetical protein